MHNAGFQDDSAAGSQATLDSSATDQEDGVETLTLPANSTSGEASSGSGSGSGSGLNGDLNGLGENKADQGDKEKVSVIGSGDFGRALAGRLVMSGYDVHVGSRDPQRHRELIEAIGARPCSREEAIRSSHIVIVAVFKDFYESLPLELFPGKVVVDVSNRNSVKRKMTLSQAEYLQSLIPDADVVKAFNVLSAYGLESGGLQGSKEVFIAGKEDHHSKESVMHLVRTCGFTPVDMGLLRSAREIEDMPVQTFPEWSGALIVSVVVFVIVFVIMFFKNQICWTIKWTPGPWHWERWNYIPTDTVNKSLSTHALNLLALCYTPGILAAYLQLYRGTKYSRFPNWLDRWLKMRKQLGLLMLFSASLHACISVAVLSPTYHESAFGYATKIKADVLVNQTALVYEENPSLKVNTNDEMHFRGELFLLTGVLSFALSVILGITSLPSVTAALTWKEFAFVQSKLGWICMILAVVHNFAYGWPYVWNVSCYLVSGFIYGSVIPLVNIILKIILLLPGVSSHLEDIRGGYERGRAKKDAKKADVV